MVQFFIQLWLKSKKFNYTYKYMAGIQTKEMLNGDIYIGETKNGLRHGKGTLKTSNNRSYEGYWKDDKPHGFGKNTFPNGKIYTGEFFNGKPIGEGLWTYSDGRTYRGKWVNGSFIGTEAKEDVRSFRLATKIINIIVISFLIVAVSFWILSFLKLI